MTRAQILNCWQRSAHLGAALLLLIPFAAGASSPVDRLSPRQDDAQQIAAPRDRQPDRKVEREVAQMEEACSSSYLERVPRVRRDCTPHMDAVVQLGERALPTLVARVAALAQASAERSLMSNSAQVLIGMINRIGGKAGTEALVQLAEKGAVQAARDSIFESVHRSLQQTTGVKVELTAHTKAARAAAAAEWRARLAPAANPAS